MLSTFAIEFAPFGGNIIPFLVNEGTEFSFAAKEGSAILNPCDYSCELYNSWIRSYRVSFFERDFRKRFIRTVVWGRGQEERLQMRLGCLMRVH